MRSPNGKDSLIYLALIFLVGIGAASFLAALQREIFYGYLILSFVTFLVYLKDKNAAQKGRWRTPESSLHLFALVGGWPGALIAQKTFRHKTSKTSFQVVFWITVILNVAALVWVYMTGFKI